MTKYYAVIQQSVYSLRLMCRYYYWPALNAYKYRGERGPKFFFYYVFFFLQWENINN